MPGGRGVVGLWGEPPRELAIDIGGARQFSPLMLESERLEEIGEGVLERMVVAAPAGGLERRYVLAQALRALAAGAPLTAVAPRRRGGLRLADELRAFGCTVREDARRHQRLCRAVRPAELVAIGPAIRAGGPQIAPALGLWSQPGIFSWDRLDPGTALLLENVGGVVGRGADLGCGVGILGRALLAAGEVTDLALIDIDRRAVDAARRNIADPRAHAAHADVRRLAPKGCAGLDFVVMNPPFHQGGVADVELGLAFIRAAAALLRDGGLCRLVANLTLPYEAEVDRLFARRSLVGGRAGYKLIEAVK